MIDQELGRLEHAREYSARSLERAAIRHGLTSYQLASRILRRIKSERARDLREHSDLIDRDYVERLLACDRLEDALRLIEVELQAFLAHDFAEAARLSRAAVDTGYLSGIAKGLGVPTRHGVLPSIEAVVRATPVVWLFDTGFSALFSPQIELDGLPAVQYHHDTDTALAVGARVILGRALEPTNDGVDMRTKPAKGGLKTDTLALLEALKGGLLEARVRPSPLSRTPEGRHLLQTITSLMQEFVLAHEYGHLLLGHMCLGPCHRAEYEADLFAASTMSLPRFTNLYQETWFAVAVIFLLLDIHARGAESPSHPRAVDRFNQLADRTGHGEEFRAVFRRLADVLNPDLRDLIGYQVTI